ncbi:MAG TPA: response regulator, partial [Terriglobales bacterium]|nr:response regulator [Terriglobales bacterium]
SGPGIREVNRIFDPFYTTKSIGKGTGLGLSICYGIVKEHGGDIRAYNHPKGGAVIEVKLPVAVAEPKAKSEDSRPAAHVVPLRGRVLIIDDEDVVLDFEQEVLKGAGAEVVVANSGRDALARLQRESFDAVLLDNSMPGGWSGPDIYRWIRANCPHLKDRVIFTVSNLTDSSIRTFLDENGLLYISKPFEVTELIALTRQTLQHARAAESHEPARTPARA